MSENKIKNYQDKLDQTLIARDRVRSSEDDHHLEFVDEVSGIAYINDSRSIRITSTRNSLEAIETSVVLILGGDDADNDYSALHQQMKQKVIAVIYLGNNADHFLKHYLSHNMLFTTASSIRESVIIASVYARSGDVVLFSPACSSYQQFDNYKNRGNEFKEIVKSFKK